MSSINGLRELVGTSLDNSGVIRLGNQLNPGTTGQVIKSNGVNNAAAWGDESIHTNEKLNIGTNITLSSGNTFYDGSVEETINTTPHTNEKLTIGGNLTTTSGNLFYDGSVAETINALDTKTPEKLTAGIGLNLSGGGDTWDGSIGDNLISFGAGYFKDNTTGYLYKNIKPSEFVMDDDSGGDNRWVISDGANTEGQAVNRGANATQIYAYFDIPSGYNFTGYRLNLNNSSGNPYTTTPSGYFFTRAGYMNNLGSRTWINATGGSGYNSHIGLYGGAQNGWGSLWQKGNSMYYGILMCYRLYWTSAYFFPGGYVEFQPI
mgnify:CR=1 FL=1